MSENLKAESLIQIMQNIKPVEDFTSQDLIHAIEKVLLETLWMELAIVNELEFYYNCSAHAQGIVFAPYGFKDVTEGNIDEYFMYDQDFDKWVDLNFDFYEDALEELVENEGYQHMPFYTQYVLCLEHGQSLNHLKISTKFNKSQFIAKHYDFNWEQYDEVDITPIPNKEKIKNLLKERGHMFGNLDVDNKRAIISALIDTLKKPHISPNRMRQSFEGMSEHLLELIKMHPQTPDELKALISISLN